MSKINDTNPEASLSTNETATPAQAKKSNLKLHAFLLLVLGVGAWSFWTYSPIISSFKTDVTGNHTAENLSPYEALTPIDTKQQTTSLLDSPTFESTPDLEQGITFEKNVLLNQQDKQTEDLNNTSSAIAELQQQIFAVNQNIHAMKQQQAQFNQAQIRTQLFTMLRQAASTQHSLHANIIAWKSITFMPLISADKKAFAEQAYTTLNSLQDKIRYTQNEISSFITTLNNQLKPHEQAAVQVANAGIDPYQQTADNTPIDWLDWLQQQYQISKSQHAVVISDDPYAKLKTLLGTLHQLKQAIQAEQWGHIDNLNTLFYQLEQYGIEVNLSTETMKSFGTTQQEWQAQAQVWMEQL